MRHISFAILLLCSCCGWFVETAVAEISASRQDDQVLISGDHFRLSIDGKRGGEITDIQLFDGSLWNRLLGAQGQTCPALTIREPSGKYLLANAKNAQISNLEVTPELAKLEVVAIPRTADGGESPWTVRLQYEVYAEGAVFINAEYILPDGEAVLSGAEMSLTIDGAVVKAAKYRQQTDVKTRKTTGFPLARVAFGVNPERSFTNEVQALVEKKTPLAGQTGFTFKDGQFTWKLADGQTTMQSPVEYQNRFSLGLGAAATGKPRTNVIGQRVYHWINWVDRKDIAGAAWYPSDEIIDQMVAHHGTKLILHMHWMDQRGSNGIPHANYRPRDEEALKHTIEHAHQKGMRVGLYCRGIERYAPSTSFVQKYLKRDWDGLYVDWDGEYCIGFHERRQRPEPALGDVHFSTDGSYLPAREYFLYLKKLRQLVGPKGFLIGHMGFGNCGVLSNLARDGYLPGESPADHDMFTGDVDRAVYQGILGGVVCMPWTVDAAQKFIGPEGMAKMAVWGFYPHACMGFRKPPTNHLLPTDPADPANAYMQPYWRVLSAVDAERSTVFNSPAVNLVAATSSDPNIPCLIYKQSGETPADEAYLVVVANLGKKPASATITLKPEVLEMSGSYQVTRIDSRSGATTPAGTTTDTIATSRLAPWQIEGLKLSKPPDALK